MGFYIKSPLESWAFKRVFNVKTQVLSHPGFLIGGGKGIRTPGTREGTTVFKTAAFDRSAIPPLSTVASAKVGLDHPNFSDGDPCSP
jgi:hypothetical protein